MLETSLFEFYLMNLIVMRKRYEKWCTHYLEGYFQKKKSKIIHRQGKFSIYGYTSSRKNAETDAHVEGKQKLLLDQVILKLLKKVAIQKV